MIEMAKALVGSSRPSSVAIRASARVAAEITGRVMEKTGFTMTGQRDGDGCVPQQADHIVTRKGRPAHFGFTGSRTSAASSRGLSLRVGALCGVCSSVGLLCVV